MGDLHARQDPDQDHLGGGDDGRQREQPEAPHQQPGDHGDRDADVEGGPVGSETREGRWQKVVDDEDDSGG